jgi:PAS domain S-box-containing protein
MEARFPPEPPGGAGLADQARTLAMVLVVLGALFVVYRCLREQLRAVSRIAGRLQVHRDRLEDELGSLRIGDALGGVTASWNELVDLTQRLLETVQRSQADEELSRVLQRAGGGALAEALNAVPEGIVYLADEVRFEYLNAAAHHFFGWTEDQAKGLTLPDAQADGIAGDVLSLLRHALQPDGSYEARTELFTANEEGGGDRSAYRVRAIPLRRAQHHGECVVMIRDVSQSVRADRAREEFITQVTHELRTPLTNIRAYAETLSSGMFDDPNVITECYNVITKETRRLSRLIEDILNVSQLEVGTIELQMGTVDLKTVLSEGVRDVRGLADERHIDIQLALPSKVEPIRGDRDKLAVVVNNLLGNAIKYTQANGHVVVGCQFTGEEAIITVKDNGIGIDPADHARIFEQFQRVLDPEVQSETGTGIGLYTAREIARHHRGDIELISEKGKGSTFLVRLPHQQSRAAAVTTAEEA